MNYQNICKSRASVSAIERQGVKVKVTRKKYSKFQCKQQKLIKVIYNYVQGYHSGLYLQKMNDIVNHSGLW